MEVFSSKGQNLAGDKIFLIPLWFQVLLKVHLCKIPMILSRGMLVNRESTSKLTKKKWNC